MGTITVCEHNYVVPAQLDFRKKYYYLLSLLLFEYKESYHKNNIRVFGFTDAEMAYLERITPYFYQEDNTLKADDFDQFILGELVSFLPDEMKKDLVDHTILSAMDNNDDARVMIEHLNALLQYVASSIPKEYLFSLDFEKFLFGEDSKFMTGYYSSEELEELRNQYGLQSR